MRTKKIKVVVTKEDISKAEATRRRYNRARNCPLARALTRVHQQLEKRVQEVGVVGTITASIRDKRGPILSQGFLSKRAKKFVANFDDIPGASKPATFILTLTEAN